MCAMCECHGVCKTALGRTNAGRNYLPNMIDKTGIISKRCDMTHRYTLHTGVFIPLKLYGTIYIYM